MKKYITIRLLLVFVNIFALATILFFALSYANFHKYYNMSFNEFYQISGRLYKIFLEERFIKMDWGITHHGDSVKELVVPAFWITMKYNVIALLIYFPLGVMIGIISAYRQGGIFDTLVNIVTLVFSSIPTYILAFLLIVSLGFAWNIFPPHYSAVQPGFINQVLGFGIPIIALSAGALSKISRVVRNELLDALQSDYFLLARVKGLTRVQTFKRHLLKNSLTALLPIMMDVFLIVLTGSFFVEMQFGIPGVAEILFDSLITPLTDIIGVIFVITIDVNTVVIICTFYMLMAFIFSFIVDVSYNIIDPRMKIHK